MRRQLACTFANAGWRQSLGMAPSAHLRISGQMALAGAGTNSGPLSGRYQANRTDRGTWCRIAWRVCRLRLGGWFGDRTGRAHRGRSAIGAFHRSRPSWKWHRPPKPGFPGEWRRRQSPGPVSLNSSKAFGWKWLRRDQLSAIMPASGWQVPSPSGAELASGLQLARSTHMTLGHHKRTKSIKGISGRDAVIALWTSGHGEPYAAGQAAARHRGGLLCHATAPSTWRTMGRRRRVHDPESGSRTDRYPTSRSTRLAPSGIVRAHG